MIAQTVQIFTERTQKWVPPTWWLPTIIIACLVVCCLNILWIYRREIRLKNPTWCAFCGEEPEDHPNLVCQNHIREVRS